MMASSTSPPRRIARSTHLCQCLPVQLDSLSDSATIGSATRNRRTSSPLHCANGLPNVATAVAAGARNKREPARRVQVLPHKHAIAGIRRGGTHTIEHCTIGRLRVRRHAFSGGPTCEGHLLARCADTKQSTVRLDVAWGAGTSGSNDSVLVLNPPQSPRPYCSSSCCLSCAVHRGRAGQ